MAVDGTLRDRSFDVGHIDVNDRHYSYNGMLRFVGLVILLFYFEDGCVVLTHFKMSYNIHLNSQNM
jgi:hypothetical protein